jgi:hypothetical protein
MWLRYKCPCIRTLSFEGLTVLSIFHHTCRFSLSSTLCMFLHILKLLFLHILGSCIVLSISYVSTKMLGLQYKTRRMYLVVMQVRGYVNELLTSRYFSFLIQKYEMSEVVIDFIIYVTHLQQWQAHCKLQKSWLIS